MKWKKRLHCLLFRKFYFVKLKKKKKSLMYLSGLPSCLGESGGLILFWSLLCHPCSLSQLNPYTSWLHMFIMHTLELHTWVGVDKYPGSSIELWISEVALCAPVSLCGGKTIKELHYLLHVCQLSGKKSGTSVGYLIHYNLSRYPAAIFLPELLSCGQMHDLVRACYKLNNTLENILLLSYFFGRSSCWWL